jgi:hypothetical protein
VFALGALALFIAFIKSYPASLLFSQGVGKHMIKWIIFSHRKNIKVNYSVDLENQYQNFSRFGPP